MPETYEPLGLKAEARYPKELALPRTTLHHLLAARTHHGDFTAYHQRFNHEDAQLECSCGRDKNPHHIFYCRKVNRGKRIPLQRDPTTTIYRLLGADFHTFVDAVARTDFFKTVCPRY
jgi:hypothetical protein